ncbi:DUF3352 domain-containing protein [bacterium]|nr:DUF3352 domain-containing protein [bacterium]
MEEQLNTMSPRSRNKTIPLVVVLLLIAASCLAAYYMIAVYFRSPVDPATYVPANAVAAVTVDLTQTAEKEAALKTILTIFKDAGVKDPTHRFFEEVNKQLRIDIKSDVIGHLSGVGAAAVLPAMTGKLPQIIAVVGTRGENDSNAIMTKLGDQLNKKKVKFDRLEYDGFYYYYVPSEGSRNPYSTGIASYVGAVKSGIVYANSDEAFKVVVDTAKGRSNLADNEYFKTMRKKGGSTFASVYYNGKSYYKLIGPAFKIASGQFAPGADNMIKDLIENNVAAVGNFDATADGISFHLKGITKKPIQSDSVSIEELASFAPKGAAVVAATTGFDNAWQDFRVQMDSNPQIAGQMNMMSNQIQQFIGIDPYADLFDRITAVGGYYDPTGPLKMNTICGNMTLVFKMDKPDVMRNSLTKIHTALSGFGFVQIKPAKVGGVDAAIVPLGQSGVFCDAISGNCLLLNLSGSNTAEGLKSAIMTSAGKSPSIVRSKSFQSVAKLLPKKATALIYCDSGSTMGFIAQNVPASDRKIVKSVSKKIGAFGVTIGSTGTKYEMKAVMPFKVR